MTVFIRMNDLKTNMFRVHHLSSLYVSFLIIGRVLVREEYKMDTQNWFLALPLTGFVTLNKSVSFSGLFPGRHWSRIKIRTILTFRLFFSPPALLRCNLHKTYYNFKVYTMLIWFIDKLQYYYRHPRSEVKSLSQVWLLATQWTVGHQAPPSMGFPRQEYWSGLPFPSLGDLPNPGIEPRSPA